MDHGAEARCDCGYFPSCARPVDDKAVGTKYLTVIGWLVVCYAIQLRSASLPAWTRD
jgi:hypothetical protein